MKPLLLSEVFPPQTGGSGRWLFEIYRRLPCAVAAGECAGAEGFDAAQELAIERMPLKFDSWGVFSGRGVNDYWRAYRQLAKLAPRERASELHCGKCLPEGWLAWMIKQTHGLPYVCYVHGEELSIGQSSRELAWMMRRVFGGAKLVVANSHNTAQLLRQQWLVAPGRLAILHPGVDAQRFMPADRDEERRQKLGWNGRQVVLTVGRLQIRKGHDILIRALPAIARQVPNVLYAIVGDGQERPRLEKLASELGVQKLVRFHGEPADEDLIGCFQQCDLFALPNREVNGDFEGFGMVLVEAQACGKAVIAGASGGTRETMQPGRTGLIIPCDGPEKLAEAVVELLADQQRREEMGQAGRQWVLDQFDWDSLAQQAATILGIERQPSRRQQPEPVYTAAT